MQRHARVYLLLAVAVLGVLDAMLFLGYTWSVGQYVRRPAAGEKFDAVVLFYADYGRLGHRTYALLEEGTALLAAGSAGSLICVGGNRPVSGYHGCEEAKAWLVARGVSPGRIVADRDSRDTIGNMRAAARIARERNAQSAILLSHVWHAPRVQVIAASEWPGAKTFSVAPSLDAWTRTLYWWELWRSAHHELVSWLLWTAFGEGGLDALVRVLRP